MADEKKPLLDAESDEGAFDVESAKVESAKGKSKEVFFVEGEKIDDDDPSELFDKKRRASIVPLKDEEDLTTVFETFWNISNTIQGLPILAIPYTFKVGYLNSRVDWVKTFTKAVSHDSE